MARRIGISDGRLQPCPSSPNCVSSQAADDAHRIEPLELTLDPAKAIAALRGVVEAMPRTKVVTCTDVYLHAEFKSRIFGWIDDVEFLLDAGSCTLNVRSASRTGYSDLGVNRKRVEEIRRALAGARP